MFEDNFEHIGSIVLDTTILIGSVNALDVSPSGRLLAGDMNAGEVRLYESTGKHVRRLEIENCAPGLDRPTMGTFVFGERIVAYNWNAAFLFDAGGICVKRIEDLVPSTMSLCSTTDTLYAFFRRGPAHIKLFSSDLDPVGQYELPPPRLPTVVSVSGGLMGREIACTANDVSYLYAVEPDVARLHGSPNDTRHEPANYTRPEVFQSNHTNTRELSDNLLELRRTADLSVGAFELGNDYRIVAFENWRPNSKRGSPGMVLNLINKTEPGQSYSFATNKWPLAARNGTLYTQDLRAEAVAANPTIDKFRLKDR